MRDAVGILMKLERPVTSEHLSRSAVYALYGKTGLALEDLH